MKCIMVYRETPQINFDSVKFYGAVVNAWAHIYPDELDGLIETIKKGETRFSSPLPYIHGHLYLPFPKVSMKRAYEFVDKGDYSRYPKLEFLKKLRGAGYIRRDIFERISGEGLTRELVEEMYRQRNEANPPLVLPRESSGEPRPHVTLNRIDNSSTIFFLEGESTPGETAGETADRLILYTTTVEKQLMGALRYIEDTGISKKVSWGMGKVGLRAGSIDDVKPPEGLSRHHILLSKYIPTEREKEAIDPKSSRFEMGLISGYRRDGKPLPLTRYITEGSLLLSNTPLVGRVIEEEDWLLSGVGLFLGGSE